MTAKENARPTVGAVGRAVETGADSRQTTTSTRNDTTPAAENQTFHVIEKAVID